MLGNADMVGHRVGLEIRTVVVRKSYHRRVLVTSCEHHDVPFAHLSDGACIPVSEDEVRLPEDPNGPQVRVVLVYR
jgi:hypothetical protein